jgi:hypothetical protein
LWCRKSIELTSPVTRIMARLSTPRRPTWREGGESVYDLALGRWLNSGGGECAHTKSVPVDAVFFEWVES